MVSSAQNLMLLLILVTLLFTNLLTLKFLLKLNWKLLILLIKFCLIPLFLLMIFSYSKFNPLNFNFMRIFQKNISLSYNGTETFKDANVNLTLLDVLTILHGLEKSKLSDPAEAEQAVSIVSVLKPLCHE